MFEYRIRCGRQTAGSVIHKTPLGVKTSDATTKKSHCRTSSIKGTEGGLCRKERFKVAEEKTDVILKLFHFSKRELVVYRQAGLRAVIKVTLDKGRSIGFVLR